jgi:8-oxo-dGTP diphosphatase
MKALKKIDKSRLIAINEDKILVLEKISVPKKYSLAGGIKKKNETDLQSLIRESFEEIGVQLKKKDLNYFISRKKVAKKDEREVYKHYFITTKAISKEVEVQEIHKFKEALWIPWYYALEYLDKEDRKVVNLYFDQFKQLANKKQLI